MTEKEIARINELARLKKERPLTQEEAAEQQKLRRQYIDAVKKSLVEDLDRMLVQDETGAYVPLREKKPAVLSIRNEPMNHRLFCFRPLHSMVLIVLK